MHQKLFSDDKTRQRLSHERQTQQNLPQQKDHNKNEQM